VADRPKAPSWRGLTVACILSGPSLTAEDCDAVHAAGLPTIVVNSSFRRAPWADILFGFDARWWVKYLDEIKASGFAGRRICMSQIVMGDGIETVHGVPWFTSYGNSGACAVSMASAAGARRVILLGADCKLGPGKRKHWHPDHEGMSNCKSIDSWPKQFSQVGREARQRGCEVLNASRETILKCFPRVDLQTALSRTLQPIRGAA
jgi:hypothetical protein